MQRLVIAALLAAVTTSGCSVEKDDRPIELEYLTQAIFAPSCGATQCHSTFAQVKNYVFDTPEGVRRGLVDGGWLTFDYERYDPHDPEDADLYVLVSTTDPFPVISGTRTPRMPYDAPLLDRDLELLKTWIQDPDRALDGQGASARGAQCNPDREFGYACRYNEVVRCTADWNFGELVELCPTGCTASCPLDQCPIPDCEPAGTPQCMTDCVPLNCTPSNMCRAP